MNPVCPMVAPIVEKSDSPLPIIVGASCAALIALLGAYLFGKRKFFISKGTDKGEIFDIQMIPGASKDFLEMLRDLSTQAVFNKSSRTAFKTI